MQQACRPSFSVTVEGKGALKGEAGEGVRLQVAHGQGRATA